MTKSKLQHALDLAAQGFYVFPIVAGKKQPPAIKGWQQAASCNPDEIRSLWAANPDYNIGISTSKFGDGEALLVVDVDNKGDKHGDQELLRLEIEGRALPGTFTVLTPTGGRHLFFIVGSPVRQGVDVLARGVDVRSRGGYVAGPGSDTAAGTYTVYSLAAVADAPDWLIDRCGRAVERVREDQPAPANLDAAAAVERATHYLRMEAPLAVEGNGGDETTYKVAARLKDFGVEAPDALQLLDVIWNPRCSPPWPIDELCRKVENAYAYGTAAPGAAAPETVFPIVTPADLVDQNPKPTHKGLTYELFHAIQPDLSRASLVQDLLDHGAMSVVYGESNTGKTFVTMDMSLHIARGVDWMGRRVDRGAAVYVAAEAGGSSRKRVVAFRKHHGLEAEQLPFALVPCSVDLLNPAADTRPLIELILEVGAKFNLPVVHLTIDTLARAIGGGNENASEDMGGFVRNIDRIRDAVKAHITIVHHSGKDRAKGARGHSSLRAATDTEIEIADLCARATKQRDMESGMPIGFSLQPVEVGQNSRGEPVKSCVVLARSVPAQAAFAPKQLKGKAKDALAVLQDMTLGGQPVSLAQWQEEVNRRMYVGADEKTAKRGFERARLAIGEQVREMNGWVEPVK